MKWIISISWTHTESLVDINACTRINTLLCAVFLLSFSLLPFRRNKGGVRTISPLIVSVRQS